MLTTRITTKQMVIALIEISLSYITPCIVIILSCIILNLQTPIGNLAFVLLPFMYMFIFPYFKFYIKNFTEKQKRMFIK